MSAPSFPKNAKKTLTGDDASTLIGPGTLIHIPKGAGCGANAGRTAVPHPRPHTLHSSVVIASPDQLSPSCHGAPHAVVVLAEAVGPRQDSSREADVGEGQHGEQRGHEVGAPRGIFRAERLPREKRAAPASRAGQPRPQERERERAREGEGRGEGERQTERKRERQKEKQKEKQKEIEKES